MVTCAMECSVFFDSVRSPSVVVEAGNIEDSMPPLQARPSDSKIVVPPLRNWLDNSFANACKGVAVG